MRVECIQPCDVTVDGPGHPADRTRACFPGIVYEFPESKQIRELVASDYLRVIQGAAVEGIDAPSTAPAKTKGAKHGHKNSPAVSAGPGDDAGGEAADPDGEASA